MKSFLENIAQWILSHSNKNLEDAVIIFPNKRAGVFFRYHLSKIINQPVWLPTITDINSFVSELSELKLADKYTLIFELYKSYQEIYNRKGHTPEEFDDFFPWGELLLNDFNDIDKYLVNAKEVLRTTSDLRTIENLYDYLTPEQKEAIRAFWENIINSKSSSQKEQFLRMWEVLFEIYSLFRKKILSKGIAYEGLIYRDVFNKIRDNKLKAPFQKYFIAGFHVLTKSESEIFSYIRKNFESSFFWDASQEFLENKDFEPFNNIRNALKKFPNPNHFELENHPLIEKNIFQFTTPGPGSQANALGSILERNKTADLLNTAIILPDENMLFPTLNKLPEDISCLNITMGYPFKNTSIAGLLKLIVNLLKNKRGSKTKTVYYFKDVVALIKHPYFEMQDNQIFLDEIIEKTKIFIKEKELSVLNSFFEKLFKIKEEKELIPLISDYLKNLYIKEGLSEFDKEFIIHAYKEFNLIGEVLLNADLNLSAQIVFNIINEVTNSLKIAFNGEPIEGLQLMGTLETRALDFENLYILGMNEGIFPSVTSKPSFIPYSIRKTFELPTFEKESDTYSYYFYRLIQRAKNIYVFSISENDLNIGEESRFIKQLKYDFGIHVKQQNLTQTIYPVENNPISIEKDKEITHRLTKFLHNGEKDLTPSALNTYIDCNLKFYFRYIANIYEKEEALEEIDQRIFGNLLHNAMEFFYKEIIENKKSSKIEKTDLEKTENYINIAINKAFSLEFEDEIKDVFTYESQHIVVKSVIKKYMEQIIKYDKSISPFEIISLENNKDYKMQVDINIDGKIEGVKLKGIIDRIDSKDGKIRIIDYKTGMDENTFNDIQSLFSGEVKKRNKAVFQTILYSLLYQFNEGNSDPIVPALYLCRNMYSDDYNYHIRKTISKGKYEVIENLKIVENEFKSNLINLLEEIFNTREFKQTEDTDKCKYCPYKEICNR